MSERKLATGSLLVEYQNNGGGAATLLELL